ncbi:MAG: hypothetical protein LIO46_04015 [Clostridiales bacterium]|nr:hypothetical protein [Clostridiales bacterium]
MVPQSTIAFVPEMRTEAFFNWSYVVQARLEPAFRFLKNPGENDKNEEDKADKKEESE